MFRRWRSPFGQAVGPIATGFGFIALLALALWGAAWLGTRSHREAALGADSLLRVRSAKALQDIARNGPRLQYVGKTQGYIYINHLGDDANKGWVAFSAVPEGLPPRCTIVFRTNQGTFSTDCAPEHTYPPTGEGLIRYEATLNPNTGDVVIDLAHAQP